MTSTIRRDRREQDLALQRGSGTYRSHARRARRHFGLDPDLFSVDGDCNGPYVSVAEFDSYDEAMKQSNDPAATESANKWDALLDEPPRSYNLNIVRDLERQRELRSAALIAEWAWAEHPLGPDGELNKLGF